MTNTLKEIQKYMILAFALAVFALVCSFFKDIATEKLLKNKDYGICIPTEIDSALPFIYHQTAINPVQNDALIKSFMEEYVHLTQNEQIVNYHKKSDDDRNDNYQLSQNRYKAVNMSVDAERALNMDLYNRSTDVFHRLQKGNVGWVFNIDDMLIYPGQNNGVTVVIVRGEFQVTYDKVKVDLPSELWGYREMIYTVIQGFPTADEEKQTGEIKDVNSSGLYVSASFMNILSPQQKNQLDERSYDYYLNRENL